MIRILFLTLIFCVMGSVAHTENTIRLTTKVWAPYQIDTGKGLVAGRSVNILNCVFEAIGHQPDYRIVPWKRAQEMSKSGQSDGYFLASQANDRDDYAVISDPLFHQDWALFYLPSATITPHHKDFKARARIAGVLGSNMTNWMEGKAYNVVMKVDKEVVLYDLLHAHRVDAYVSNLEAGLALLKKKEVGIDKVRYSVFRSKPLGVYFTNKFLEKKPSFMEEFNETLVKCRIKETVE